MAYITFLFKAGAGAKDAQSLARHESLNLTMNTYARTRDERLADLAEAFGMAVLPLDNTTIAQQKVVGVVSDCSGRDLVTAGSGSRTHNLSFTKATLCH